MLFSFSRAKADLNAYFNRPEPAYKWEKTSQKEVDGGTIYDLHLVSQTWQGIVWEHRLQLFHPKDAKTPHFCTLLNTGGNGGVTEQILGMTLAKETGSNFAILYNIPNQPLYDGKKEDALVVYTWLKYMETGDESWPLHFPMAKAVLKAMDALQAFSKESTLPEINEFLITGASKRGWTTWLAGASQDKRIKAIAPMVIDTLNLTAQGAHQLESYGKFSEQIADYTLVNMNEKLKSPAGQRLMQLEDPYSYRQILTLPKLLILGTNDRYWSQDSLNLYWDGLKSPKWVLYTPNSGHGLEDKQRVYNTLAAYSRTIASNAKWPQIKWNYSPAGYGVDLVVRSDVPPKSARLFSVSSATKDFRDSKWIFLELPTPDSKKNIAVKTRIDSPTTGYTANYMELTFEIEGKNFTLSTQIQILPAKPTIAK